MRIQFRETSRASISDAATVPLLRLNYDILFWIMKFLEKKDLLSFMSCSRALLRQGTKVLLVNTREYRLHKLPDRRYWAFLDFVLADAPFRARYLRTLCITRANHPSAMPARALAGVLAHAPNLTALTLHNAEELLAHAPHLGGAFRGLGQLKLIQLRHAGRGWIGLLEQLRAPLVDAEIALVGPDAEPALDAACILQGCAGTLRVLALTIRGAVEHRLGPFPQLRKFIYAPSATVLGAPLLGAAFPALERLDIAFDSKIAYRVVQPRLGGGAGGGPQWRVLDYVHGSAPLLDEMGLRTRVKSLHLAYDAMDGDGVLMDVVRNNPAEKVTKYCRFEEVPRIVRAVEGAPAPVKELRLGVSIEPGMVRKLGWVLAKIAGVCSKVRLTQIQLYPAYDDEELPRAMVRGVVDLLIGSDDSPRFLQSAVHLRGLSVIQDAERGLKINWRVVRTGARPVLELSGMSGAEF
ncbi:hypothetical protein CERSUDRAFT_100899 [Gelatoporia subvermispora B]|uniref:F-box domain-containing protein n=1 Tax=Ceriporiopsis subvermispora (strain B) TaxID=914234 RepID=M2QFV6_CERS8|nr:hypothetical protein CERSUDRAFT_100899 [Gelatoporia subvermispora B]